MREEEEEEEEVSPHSTRWRDTSKHNKVVPPPRAPCPAHEYTRAGGYLWDEHVPKTVRACRDGGEEKC
jgi:hypothetical protein